MPGHVVRSIGACYSYISEEQAVPAGLHERILQATLGTTEAQAVRAPLAARLLEGLRGWLDVVLGDARLTMAKEAATLESLPSKRRNASTTTRTSSWLPELDRTPVMALATSPTSAPLLVSRVTVAGTRPDLSVTVILP